MIKLYFIFIQLSFYYLLDLASYPSSNKKQNNKTGLCSSPGAAHRARESIAAYQWLLISFCYPLIVAERSTWA